MDKRYLIAVVLLLLFGCQNRTLSEFRDLSQSHLVFAFEKDEFRYISRVNWSYQDRIAIQGLNPQAHAWPIYIGNISTGSLNPVLFHGHPLSAYNPVISPNGMWLAFLPDSQENEYGVKIVEFEAILENGYTLPESLISIDVQSHVRLAWSPDSTQLAVLGFGDHNVLTLNIYEISEKSLKKIFEYSEENPNNGNIYIGRIEYTISWSSDGRKLAFSLEQETDSETQSDLYIYDLDRNRFTNVTATANISERYPTWFPKSDVLVYVSIQEGTSVGYTDGKLVFATGDGRCKRTLPGLVGIASPTWSPDGTQIAYLSEDGVEVIDIANLIPPEFLSPQGLCELSK